MHRVPSLCSSSMPAARDTLRLEIFSLMAFAISIILRNKHTKQMESLLNVTAQGMSLLRAGVSSTLMLQATETGSPKWPPGERQARPAPARAIKQFHFNT